MSDPGTELKNLAMRIARNGDREEVLDLMEVRENPTLGEDIGHRVMEWQDEGNWPTIVPNGHGDTLDVVEGGETKCTVHLGHSARPGRPTQTSPTYDTTLTFGDNCSEFHKQFVRYKEMQRRD